MALPVTFPTHNLYSGSKLDLFYNMFHGLCAYVDNKAVHFIKICSYLPSMSNKGTWGPFCNPTGFESKQSSICMGVVYSPVL